MRRLSHPAVVLLLVLASLSAGAGAQARLAPKGARHHLRPAAAAHHAARHERLRDARPGRKAGHAAKAHHGKALAQPRLAVTAPAAAPATGAAPAAPAVAPAPEAPIDLAAAAPIVAPASDQK